MSPSPVKPNSPVQPHSLAKVVDEQAVAARVAELAREVNACYAGRPLLVICVLKGAFMFCSDLVKHLDMDVNIDFIRLASYHNDTRSSGNVRVLTDLDTDIEGRDVLVVEDIVDTGLSLEFLVHLLGARNPASLKTCAFIDKPTRRTVQAAVDFCGFTLEKGFLVGYGLDYAQKYRHLDAIYEVVFDS